MLRIITDPNSGLSSAQVPYSQLLLPYPQFTWVATEPQLIANSIYHGLQLLAEKRYSNGLQFLVTYTWSKSIDDSSQADDNVTWLGSFYQPAGSEQAGAGAEPVDLRHSACDSVQLQLRSAVWTR